MRHALQLGIGQDERTGAIWSNHGDVAIANRTITLNSAGIGGDLNIIEPVPFDQRLTCFTRVFGSTVGLEAYELQAVNLIVDTNVDENDGNYGPGDLSLREAILLANEYPGADTITASGSASALQAITRPSASVAFEFSCHEETKPSVATQQWY